jgi:hypothetical protein
VAVRPSYIQDARFFKVKVLPVTFSDNFQRLMSLCLVISLQFKLRNFRWKYERFLLVHLVYILGDQKVSVHLMITIQKVTSNVQSVLRQSLQTFNDTPNCVLEDRVPYSTVHIPNVLCDGHLQIINCVGIVMVMCTENLWSSCVYIVTTYRFYHKIFRRCKYLIWGDYEGT